jgi:DnaJ-class molecular chaperone
MTKERAAKVLDVSLDGLTVEGIRSAYGQAVLECHPDAGGGRDTAASRLKAVRLARDLLVKELGENTTGDTLGTCPKCNGLGFVPSPSFNGNPCARCGGTGKTRNR